MSWSPHTPSLPDPQYFPKGSSALKTENKIILTLEGLKKHNIANRYNYQT